MRVVHRIPRSPWRIRSALPRWILAGDLFKVLATIAIALISHCAQRQRAEEVEIANRAVKRLAAVEGVMLALTSAETGQRGYLVTGDDSYLEPYRSAQPVIAADLQLLGELVADVPEQPARVRRLDTTAAHWLDFARSTIDLARQGKRDEAIELMRTGDDGKLYMEQARLLVGRIESAEHARLAVSTEARDEVATLVVGITWGGSIVLIVLMVGVGYASARAFRDREIQDWIKTAETTLNTELIGNASVSDIATRAIRCVAASLEAEIGALHVRMVEDRFERLATYAFAGPTDAGSSFRAGEGLVGEAVLERRVLAISDVPDDYFAVKSSLGARKPRHLMVVPALADGEVEAVIELGFFRSVASAEHELLERAAMTIATAIRSARYRERQAELLEESQNQAEELLESQAQIEANQRDLEEANAQLEEHTRALEAQKEGLLEARRALEYQTDQLAQTSRYKSEFLANMSHELRTPLNSLLIFAKLLSDNRDGNLSAEQIRFAQSIATSGMDLLALINDILDLSKIEARRIDLDIDDVPIAGLLEDLRRRFEPIANERGLELIISAGGPVVIESDRQRLMQVLANLVSNALKFTEQGRVTVTASAHGPLHVAFAVEDTGIGIAPEHHEVIFEAFRQADGTTNRRFGGTGLGLSISRELAGLLGGEIKVQSAVGAGSTFTVIVPLAGGAIASTSAHARKAVAQPPPPPIKTALIPDDREQHVDARRTVLVVEDDAAFAGILRDLARELGFRCVVAGDADEALRLAREQTPAAVVLDIGLPDHSGMTVLELMKRDPTTRHVPIHVVSVHDYEQVALEMGAVGYALKPVKREQLVEAFGKLEATLARTIKRILVIEDDASQREAITKLLSAAGVEIVAVATAAAAREQLREGTFDCCVLDLGLPGTSGFELLDEPSSGARTLPPIIVYTARALTPDEELQLRRRSRSIIIKGARSPERLVEEVSLFLHQVEANLPSEQQRMLRAVRDREKVFEGRRILIAEDDARTIFALSKLLEPKGAVIEIARNGKAAVERVNHEPRIDLVLMDIMMPEMDGISAMREIRKHEIHRALPIIAATSKAMGDDRLACLAAGANDYIAKPVDLEKLLSLLRVWMPR